MAIKVIDTRTVINEADSTTTPDTWTGPSITAGTAVYVEAPNSIIGTLNIATGQSYVTKGTPVNAANQLVYVWSNNYALQGSWLDANPPNALYLSDGTNSISFKMAGADRKVFSHLTNQAVDWDCLVLDTSQAAVMNAAGLTVVRAGSFAAFNSASLTRFGSDFTTLSKGLGGGTNVATDIIRMGNDGLVIASGSSANPGSFLDIVVEDRSTASLKAHGIIREYTSGLYGCQGPLTFGTGSEGTWFQDSDFTLVYENRNISNDKYYFKVTGSLVTSSVYLNNGSISTAGPWVRMDYSSDRIIDLRLTNMTFRGLSGSVTFGTDVTASLSHSVNNNSFVRSGPIYVNSVNFDNNTIQTSLQVVPTSGSLLNTTISDSVVGTDSGALYWNIELDPNGKLDGMTFVKGTATNHGIEFGTNAPATMSLESITFTNYGADSGSDAAIYNNSGKDLLINITGDGTFPTVRNATGLSTTLVAGLVDVTLTGLQPFTEVRILDSATQDELDGIEDTIADIFTFTVSSGAVIDIVIVHVEYEYIRINNFTVPANDTSIPIEQRFDRNYNNP